MYKNRSKGPVGTSESKHKYGISRENITGKAISWQMTYYQFEKEHHKYRCKDQ